MSKPILPLNQIIYVLNSGNHWNAPTITYLLPGGAPATRLKDHAKVVDLPDDGKPSPFVQPNSWSTVEKVWTAFELWDDLIALDLNPTADLNNPNITFTFSSNRGRDGALGSSDIGPQWGNAADIFMFHQEQNGVVSLDGMNPSYNSGSQTFFNYVHEIGHALGLEHPFPEDGDVASHETRAVYAQDTIQYTTMSYSAEKHFASGANYKLNGTTQLFPQTPMLHDIAAIQAIYGADFTTRTGHTVYGFNSSAGLADVFNFNVNTSPIITIYDAGGIDTLNVSGFTQNQIIDLRPGHYSSIGALTQNVAMAFNQTSGKNGHARFNPNAVIENAVGGSGHDTITGNDARNDLTGGEGNDALDGGIGADNMFGGVGNDTYYVDDANDVVNETGFKGIFRVDLGGKDEIRTTRDTYALPTADAGLPTYVGAVENLTYIGTGSFTGTGNGLANIIRGGAQGDMLDGGAGIDKLYGGGGSDIYFVDNENDIVSELTPGGGFIQMFADGGGIDEVRATSSSYKLSDDLVTSGKIENLTYIGSGAFTGIDNSLANTIIGRDLGDTLDGGVGADIVIGGDGNDTIIGGADSDTLYGNDRSRNATAFDPFGPDPLEGNFNPNLVMSDSDTFRFANGWGQDTIMDFELGRDKIDLKGVAGVNLLKHLTITDTVQGAMIAFGSDSIILNGIRASQVTDSIFDFTSVVTGTRVGGIRTTQTFDSHNTETWTDYTLWHDGQGRQVKKIVNYDNGNRSDQYWDVANTANWSSYAENFDAKGRLVGKTVYNDNKTRAEIGWDAANTATWKDYTINYDAQNRAVSKFVNYDNGTRAEIGWDAANTATWKDYTINYDAQNRAVSKFVNNDNGTRAEIGWDAANTATWKDYTINYDAQGRSVSKFVNYDNGARSKQQWDVTNSFNWSEDLKNYDAQGRLINQTVVYDNGTRNVRTWDVDNKVNWADYVNSYDAQNRLTTKTVIYDDGARSVSQWDVANASNWSSMTTNYDAQGHITSQSGVYDNGTLFNL